MAGAKHDGDREKAIVLGIFVLAYALRFVYMLQMQSSPNFSSPTMDPLFHDTWAQNIAGGNWIGSQAFFRAPFYAYFLALIYKILGHGYVIPRLIQHLIGSFSCVLVYLVARRLFGRTVAVVAGLMAATYGMFLYFEGELLLDSLLVFLDLLLILLLLRAKEAPKLSLWFASGLVLGLSAITRPNILFFIPFVWLWMYFVFRQKKPLKRMVWYGGLFLAGCILMVLPVTVRNIAVSGDAVLISSQGGINFYIGNNQNADGVSAVLNDAGWDYRDFQVEAEEEAGRSLKPSQVSNFYYRKGLDFFLSKPARAFELLTKKLYLFWSRLELSNNQDIYFYRRYSSLIRILPLGFWLIGPLGLTGMVLSLLPRSGSKKARSGNMSERKKDALLPVLFVFSYMITVVMFFVPARFRLPVVPFLIVFSAFALVWIIRRVLKKDLRSAVVFVGLLVPGVLLTETNAYHLGVSGATASQAHFALGNVYLKNGQLDAALAQFDTVLALDPAAAQAHLNRGLVFFRKGDYRQAEQEYLTELRLHPDEDKAYNNLAALYIEQGRHAEGQEMARKAMALRKYAPYGYVNLATSYRRTGKDREAKQVISEGFARVTPFLEGNLLLGEILQSEGKVDSAMEQFEKAANPAGSARDVNYDLEALAAKGGPLNPEESHLRAKAHFNMATILIHQGKFDEAETHLRQALSLWPDMAEAYANLGIICHHAGRENEAVSLLGKAISINPGNAVYHYNLGLVYAKQRQLQSARDEFQTSLDLDPSRSDARQRLIWADSLLQSQSGSP